MEKSPKTKSEKLLKTPYGLHNQGATCYLNSVLQLLFMTPDFHKRLQTNIKTDQVITTLFDNLMEGACETKDITKHLQIEDVHKQCDAAEYLELILNRTGRRASEIFRGELFYSTKCCQNHTINEETNSFWTLPLPLRDQNSGVFSVETGLRRIFMKKSFSGNSKVFCEDCVGSTDAERECEMKVAPQVLVLLLKRFVFDHNTGSHVKSNCTVEIPTSLQIKEKSYDLYGIVDHWGSLRSGHYTATIQSKDDKTWFKFNDNSVQKVKEKPTDDCRSDTAYLLAYREKKQNQTTIPIPEPPVNPIYNNETETRNISNLRTSRQRNTALIVFGVVGASILFIVVLGLILGLTIK